MIIEYWNTYEEEVKDLLVELHEHIKSIDKEGYNILGSDFREAYFKRIMEDVLKYEGKIFLYKDNDEIVGLIVGLINNEKEEDYDYMVPKRGRITELVVSSNCRSKGIGTILLEEMEKYLKSVGCQDILLGVFAYNEKAINFYERHGYYPRMIDMTKSSCN